MTETRRLVYVVNPAAGQGKFLDRARAAAEENHADFLHMTEGVGECAEFIASACLTDPHTHFVVYGGDGTAGEAVDGIMRVGAGESAGLTVVPCGSGNDFHRGISGIKIPDGEDSIALDLLRVNGRYSLNVSNVGFDCNVVAATEALRRKRFLNNGLSYICGVATELVKKKTFSADVRFGGVVYADGRTVAEETVSGDFLLCAMGNLPFYGGGFKAVAAASPTDGKMDVILARGMSRARFISLVGSYRKGTHVNAETWTPYPNFAPYIEYRRCDRVTFSGIERVCLDGEIVPATGVRAEIVPAAIRYVPMKTE